MINLKDFLIKEGLADWDKGDFEKSIKKETSKPALKKLIKQWIKEYAGPSYISKVKINLNSSPIIVDTECDIWIKSKELTNGMFEWGTIDGDFRVPAYKMETFEGMPKEVTGRCYIESGKNLKSLEGLPKKNKYIKN